jgi:magnesium-transporting ATPase (P-type)
VVRADGSADRVPWSQIWLGDVVRLDHHDSPPCDLLVLRAQGGLRAREKDLTGESKPVNKQVADPVPDGMGGLDGTGGGWPSRGMRVETERGRDTVRLGGSGRVLDASYQLFRGTTVLLSRARGARPFVEGVAVRLGHECKMYRECRLAAAQPPSVLLERMSYIGMLLVLLLIGFTYDNTLAIIATGAANGASFGKVGMSGVRGNWGTH